MKDHRQNLCQESVENDPLTSSAVGVYNNVADTKLRHDSCFKFWNMTGGLKPKVPNS